MNLFAGVIAVMLAVSDNLIAAAFFVFVGIFFDFFDGLVARLLDAHTELGKQLDSLADVVTSGVAPGIVMFQLLMRSIHKDWMDGLSCEIGNWVGFEETANTSWIDTQIHFLPFTGIVLTLGAAYRLGKFNIDDKQTNSFIGLPTPAMALFVLSLPLILEYSNNELITNLILNQYFLIVVVIVFSFLMNATIPLFSLKFKEFSLTKNFIESIFIIISILLLFALKFVAIPVIILFYVFLSILKNSLNKA